MEYFLGLGSNIGDKLHYLQKTCTLLEKKGTILKKSMVYKSEPYGKKDQDFFLNAVIIFKSDSKPGSMLKLIKSLEKEIGRQETVRWGPREIDIDILDYDGIAVNNKSLTVPHQDLENRSFVLYPLQDVSGNFKTRRGKTIKELLKNCKDNGKIEIFKREW